MDTLSLEAVSRQILAHIFSHELVDEVMHLENPTICNQQVVLRVYIALTPGVGIKRETENSAEELGINVTETINSKDRFG